MYNQTLIIPATGIGAIGICCSSCCCYTWMPILHLILLAIIAILLGLLVRQVYKLYKGENQLRHK